MTCKGRAVNIFEEESFQSEVIDRSRVLRDLKREGLAVTKAMALGPGVYSPHKTITYYLITSKGLKVLKEHGL